MEGPMLEQLMEDFRKASGSALQVQQDLARQWSQQWAAATPPTMPGPQPDWSNSANKRAIDMAVDNLNRHRQSLEAAYRQSTEIVTHALRVGDAKSPEDYRRNVEELWGKLFATFSAQSEMLFRDFYRWAQKLFESIPKAGGRP